MVLAGRSFVRDHTLPVTVVLSLVGYAAVALVFLGPTPFPDLSDETTLLFGDLIAVVNAATLVAIAIGVRAIRNRRIRRHRAAMLTAFALILCFLALYLWKVGGGFEKSIVIPADAVLGSYRGHVRLAYLAMLAIHVVLSVVAVPVVLYAVLLGLSHPVDELGDTLHPRVGRVAVAAWGISLALGLVTYVLLNHVYTWTPL